MAIALHIWVRSKAA